MTDPLVDALAPKLQARIARALARHHLPGASVGVVRDTQLAWSAGFGLADLASGRQPDADTVYRVASISKTFTATAVLQLRDTGRLRLDDPVLRYVPEVGAVRHQHGAPENLTLRRLLCHHSGLITEGPFDYWSTLAFPTMAELLARLPDTEVVIAPDSAAKYGNLAYALLGEVVARVSGRSFAEYARTELLEPLAMTSSGFVATEALLARKATGYDEHPFEDEPPPVQHTETHGLAAAAGLYTTVRDLARWIAFQFRAAGDDGAGAQVLVGPTLAEMHHPQHVDPTWTMGYGLGWMSTRRGERIDVGHGGSIHGFISHLSFNVSRRLGAIVLTNEGRHTAAAEIGVETMDVLCQGFDEAGGAAPASRAPSPTPSAWKSYLGRYRLWGADVQVECRDGQLRLDTVPPGGRALHAPAPFEPTDRPHVFRVAAGRAAGELATFALGPDGTATGFTLAGFTYPRLVPALRRLAPGPP